MKYAIWLSGEHPTLPYAELKGAVEAEGADILGISGRIAVVAGKNAGMVFPRMGYARRSSLLISHGDYETVKRGIENADLPEGSFAVRAYRYGDFPGKRRDVERRIGEVIFKQRKIDLENPEHVLEIYLGNEIFAGLKIEDERKLSEREPQKRPFFSPVTLSPKMARALINLVRVKRGERLLDPFCGTGGILTEAGLIGVIPVGADFDGEMLEGAGKNMGFYGIETELYRMDVGEIASLGEMHAVATDPPYGKSSRTGGEPVEKIYERAFSAIEEVLDAGRYLSIILTDRRYCEIAKGFRLVEIHPVRVHRSLTRNFCLFRRYGDGEK